jgi:hypothetical protein
MELISLQQKERIEQLIQRIPIPSLTPLKLTYSALLVTMKKDKTGKDEIHHIYQDGTDADWQNNPKSDTIKTIQVTSKSKIKLHLVSGGGAAISFKPIN